MPKKVRIDNLKTAITRARYYEPTVQRSYADLALGYGFDQDLEARADVIGGRGGTGTDRDFLDPLMLRTIEEGVAGTALGDLVRHVEAEPAEGDALF